MTKILAKIIWHQKRWPLTELLEAINLLNLLNLSGAKNVGHFSQSLFLGDGCGRQKQLRGFAVSAGVSTALTNCIKRIFYE